MSTWRMRIPCLITKATHAHTHTNTHTHTHTHIQNMKYLLFDNKNADVNATLWYITYFVNFFRGFSARLKRVSAATVSGAVRALSIV